MNLRVRIGGQEWSLINLDVENFRNGDIIPQAQTDEEWEQMATEGKPAWCFHPEKHNKESRHGKLYNWFAVIDERGLAPEGWRVPAYEDWVGLINYIGSNPESKLKSKNWNGTNESGFEALPSGARCGPDTIEEWEFQGSEAEEYAAFWSITEGSREDEAVSVIFGDLVELYFNSESKRHGLSVRLIKE